MYGARLAMSTLQLPGQLFPIRMYILQRSSCMRDPKQWNFSDNGEARLHAR